MKQRLTFYLLVFLLTMAQFAGAQQWMHDSIAYKTSIYEVKKKSESVSDIAQKLKVDPALVSSLNNSLSIDSILCKGQKLVVPTFRKAGVGAKSKTGNLVDGNSQTSNGSANITHAVVPAVDTDLIQNYILLTDATLDLNRALLQGIQASLDSLNVKDKNVIDEKNISLTIHRMQRQRDRAMLTPVLLHMQDSLKTEIGREEVDKVKFETMLGKSEATVKEPDAVSVPAVAIKDTTSKVEAIDVIRPDTVEVISKKEPPAKTSDKPVVISDTVNQPLTSVKADTIIYKAPVTVKDTISSSALNVAPNVIPVKAESKKKKKKPAENIETAVTKPDTLSQAVTTVKADSISQPSEPVHIRPVIEANPSTGAATAVPVMHWETAKAIYFNDDTAAEVQNTNPSDEHAPVKATANGGTSHPMSDSSRIIKAQYYFVVALKASNGKKFKEAAEYLNKAIDLSPRYYDAWFALGEAEMHMGYYTKALFEFKKCSTIDSSKANLYYKMGIVQLKLKFKSEAFVSFNKSLRLDADYIPAIMSRASEYVDRGQYKAAIKEYGRVLQIEPAYHTAFKLKAMVEYTQQNYNDAIDDFTRFLIFNETDGSVYYYRGLARLKQNDLADACTDLSVSAKLGYAAALKALDVDCK